MPKIIFGIDWHIYFNKIKKKIGIYFIKEIGTSSNLAYFNMEYYY